jgi:hypothetical protein
MLMYSVKILQTIWRRAVKLCQFTERIREVMQQCSNICEEHQHIKTVFAKYVIKRGLNSGKAGFPVSKALVFLYAVRQGS